MGPKDPYQYHLQVHLYHLQLAQLIVLQTNIRLRPKRMCQWLEMNLAQKDLSPGPKSPLRKSRRFSKRFKSLLVINPREARSKKLEVSNPLTVSRPKAQVLNKMIVNQLIVHHKFLLTASHLKMKRWRMKPKAPLGTSNLRLLVRPCRAMTRLLATYQRSWGRYLPLHPYQALAKSVTSPRRQQATQRQSWRLRKSSRRLLYLPVRPRRQYQALRSLSPQNLSFTK